jgi:hypothetical protein
MFPVVGMHEELEVAGSTESRETDEDWMRPFSVGSRTAEESESGHPLFAKVDDRCTRMIPGGRLEVQCPPHAAAGKVPVERLPLVAHQGIRHAV